MKREILEKVKEHGVRRWKKGMEEKSTLGIYMEKEWGMAKYIQVVGRKEDLARARGGDWLTRDRTREWRDGGGKCPGCGHERETREHIIWECKEYKAIRAKVLRRVSEEGIEVGQRGGGDWTEETRYVLGIGAGMEVREFGVKFWEWRMACMSEIWKARNECVKRAENRR